MLRNNDDYRDPRCRLSYYKKSFLPSTSRNWNDLDLQIRNSPSINVFKNKLINNKQIAPTYFKTGIRF